MPPTSRKNSVAPPSRKNSVAQPSLANSEEKTSSDPESTDVEVLKNEKGEPLAGRIVGGKYVNDEN